MKMKHGVGAAMVEALTRAVQPAFDGLALAHKLAVVATKERKPLDDADLTAIRTARIAAQLAHFQMQMQMVATLAGIGDMLAKLVEVQVPEPDGDEEPFTGWEATKVGEPFNMAVADLPAFLESANAALNDVFGGGVRVVGGPADSNALGFAIKVDKLPAEFLNADGSPDHEVLVSRLGDVLAECQKPFEKSDEDAAKINAAARSPLHSDQRTAEPKASPGAINVDGTEGTQ